MKRNQVILIVVAVAAILLLYGLPKVMVNNKGKENNLASRQPEDNVDEQSASPASQPTEEKMPAHSQKVPTEIADSIASVKEILKSKEYPQKSTKFAALLVELYSNVSKYDSAAYFAEKISKENPSEENLLRTANLYYEAYTYAVDNKKSRELGKTARRYLQKVLDENPNNLEVKTKLAMTYVGGNSPMKGIMMLREVVEEDPNNELAIFNLGILSIQSAQYDKAINRLEKLVKLDPKHIQGQFYLGVAYMNAGQKEAARKQLEKVKKLDSDPAIQAAVDNYLEKLN